MIGRRSAIAAIGALALLLLAAQPALATFHEMMIREVYLGSAAHPNSEYVELQMWAPGQNLVGGHQISVYDKSGSPVGTATFAHDVAGDVNQSTLVAATPEAEAEFGLGADAAMAPGLLDPAGGAVCWESLDCASWGSFSGPTPSPTGSPVSPGGIPDGMALRRTIEPGCPTLLEPGDDRDNSAADFASVFPGPRPNSVSPSEHACSSQAAAGGGSASPGSGPAGAAKKRPQTRIRSGPGHSIHDRTPTFRFTSSVAGSTYLCKLDGARFKRCHSPFTTPGLRLGRHVFKVKARSPGGLADSTPAIYVFRIQSRTPMALLTIALGGQSSSGLSSSCRSRKWRRLTAKTMRAKVIQPFASGLSRRRNSPTAPIGRITARLTQTLRKLMSSIAM